jgi:hypothetical protein
MFNDDDMKIKSYPKSELAMLYFPDSHPRVAVNHLNEWIKRCQPLAAALADCHQGRYAKFWSAQAVRLIVGYLGEP